MPARALTANETAQKGRINGGGKMGHFLCTGRDGVIRAFRYVYEEELNGTHSFMAYSVPPPVDGTAFEATFTDIDADTVRQTMIVHHGHLSYREKGIPDSLLPIAAAKLGKMVVSSPSVAPGGGVFRTVDATAMWNRLVARGIASYDQATDIYTLA